MPNKRIKVPQKIKVKIHTEAGYRCAIPTCKAPVACEIAHIEAYSKSKNNDSNNLIALCPTCHTRFDKGEISLEAIRYYKQNLLLLNGRYTDIERRILEIFILDSNKTLEIIPAVLNIAYRQLVEDELFYTQEPGSTIKIGGFSLGMVKLVITDKGKELLKNIRKGSLLV